MSSSIRREWHEGESSPRTGKLSARPAGKPGVFSRQREFATIPYLPLRFHRRQHYAAGLRFSGMAESIGPMGFKVKSKNQNHLNPSGEPPPVGRPPAPGKGRDGRNYAPCSSSAMSSGRLFLDRVARQQGPSPLHRHTQHNMPLSVSPAKGDISILLGRGHFYFALTIHCPLLTICYA